MERPVSFSAEDIRDEKVKVLRAVPPIKKEDVLLGQYVASGDKPGYLDDDTVPKGSNCPTFAEQVLFINNPRWEGVPFIMKAGKALNEAKVEIRVQYRDVTQGIFSDIARNELVRSLSCPLHSSHCSPADPLLSSLSRSQVIRIQPSEAIYMKFNSKTPGLATKVVPTELDLTYDRRFSDSKIPEAYEALILDAFKGDHSNFVRDDELDAAWKIFTPILHWIEGKDGEAPKPEPYAYGSRGPKEVDEFTEKYGFVRSNQGYEWPQTSVANKL